MTIYFMEGFDSITDENELNQFPDITAIGGADIYDSTQAYKGVGRCLRLYNSEYIYYDFNSSITQVVMGTHMRTNTFLNGIFRPHDSAYPNNFHCDVGSNSYGQLYLENSLGTKVETVGGVIPINSWFHMEIKFILNDSCEVKINGSTVLFNDTADFLYGTSPLNRVRIGNETASYTYFDNLFIADDWQGQMEIITLRPTGDGTHTDFSLSTGTDHYAVVDEETYSDTDYSEGTAQGDKETYTTTVSGINGPIKAVSVSNRAWKDGQTDVTVKNIIRVGSTDYQGEEHALPSTAAIKPYEVWELNPNTSALWTPTDLSNMEFGMEIATLSTTTTTV